MTENQGDKEFRVTVEEARNNASNPKWLDDKMEKAGFDPNKTVRRYEDQGTAEIVYVQDSEL